MMAQKALLPNVTHWSETPVARVLRPMQEFIHQSTSTGIVLFFATVAALLFANTEGWAASYEHALHTYIAFGIPDTPFYLKMSALHWINDGLMAIFFLLVGLEIKREVQVGELSSVRAAALPIVAAVGGVIVPALVYALFNLGTVGQAGWAIPTATDIAFAVGCLALLGSRIPFSLKVFLTAVAVVDDLMAVLVIALFYSSGINFTALAFGFAILGLLFMANVLGFRSLLLYLGLGALVWLAFLQSGIHATIAGVLVALTIPARYQINESTFSRRVHKLMDEFQNDNVDMTPMLTNERQQSIVLELEEACEQVQAPLQKLEHELHPWVSFLIMPIFAFANAGVHIELSGLSGDNTLIVLGVALGLLIGKPVGILAASWLAVRFGIASLPSGVSWTHMTGVAILAGIGFTMSLFIASLGLPAELLAGAKIGILSASLLSAIIGLALLSRTKAPQGSLQPIPAHS
ncbi:MAG: Na+/H+ antiporter NhaA [Ardenticatenaceae bacterium]